MPLTKYAVRVIPPAGESVVVDILDPSGTSVGIAYSTIRGGDQVALPRTITGQTDFYLPTAGAYDVSVKLNDVEIAAAGGMQRVTLAGGNPVRVEPVLNEDERVSLAAASGGSIESSSVVLRPISDRTLAGGASDYHDLTMYQTPVVVGTALTADESWGLVSVREDGLMVATAYINGVPTTTGSSKLVLELLGSAEGDGDTISVQATLDVDDGAATKRPGVTAFTIGHCLAADPPLDGFGIRVTNTGSDSIDYGVVVRIHCLS